VRHNSAACGSSQAGHKREDSFAFIARELVENLQIKNPRDQALEHELGLTPFEFSVAAALCCEGRRVMIQEDAAIAFEAGAQKGEKLKENFRRRRRVRGYDETRKTDGKKIKKAMEITYANKMEERKELRKEGRVEPVKVEVSSYQLKKTSYNADRIKDAIDQLSRIGIKISSRTFPPLIKKYKPIQTSRGTVFRIWLNYGWFDHAPYRTEDGWIRVRFPLPGTHVALRLLLFLLRINASRNKGRMPITKLKQILGLPEKLPPSQFEQKLGFALSSLNKAIKRQGYRDYTYKVVTERGEKHVRFEGGGIFRIRLDSKTKQAKEAKTKEATDLDDDPTEYELEQRYSAHLERLEIERLGSRNSTYSPR
jgi:hypothetical protein